MYSKIESSNISPRFTVGDLQASKDSEFYIKETSTFTLDDGDDTYFATYWKPKQVEKPKGLVFISHGFAEYFCPSYDEISEVLVQSGYFVFGHDHIGYGRSTGDRATVKNFDEYVLPLLAHVKKVQNDFNKEVPLSIIGHSMGGLITVYAAMAEPDLFQSIVLMAPYIQSNPKDVTPIKKMLGKFLGPLVASCFPSLIVSCNRDKSGVSRNQAVVNRVAEDTLGWHGGMKLGLVIILLKAIDGLEQNECLKTITAPLLVLQGGQDKSVFPEGATFVHDNVGSVNKKLLWYEDALHNLYCELEDVKAEAIKETCSWIEQYS